jgi:hypothetical protein
MPSVVAAVAVALLLRSHVVNRSTTGTTIDVHQLAVQRIHHSYEISLRYTISWKKSPLSAKSANGQWTETEILEWETIDDI